MLRRLGFWSSAFTSVWLFAACGAEPEASSKSAPAPDSARDRVRSRSRIVAWPSSGRSAHSAAAAGEAARRYASDLVAGRVGKERQASLGVRAVHDTGRGPLVVRMGRFDGVGIAGCAS